MVRFIVDSTFGLTKEYSEKHEVPIVSLTLDLNGREYVEGHVHEWDAFYSDYTRTKACAKTSQPAPELFIKAVKDIFEKDDQAEIVILTIGDRLSGTVGSARIAAMQFPDKKIAVIDSHNGGISAFVLLDELIKVRDTGAGFEEIVALANDMRDRIATRFIPQSLTELARSGRVNKLLSRLGNILNIKPVFEYAKNELCVIGKSLGIKRAIQFSVETLPKFSRIAICYIHDDKLVAPLKEKLFRTYGMSHIDVLPMCPVGGAHIGIGTVGIITLSDNK